MTVPRPYIPYSVRVAVAQRQAHQATLERGETSPPCTGVGNDSERLRCLLDYIFTSDRPPLALDHDPALAARPYDPTVSDVAARFTPNANDPNHLIYRTKQDHQIKTNVRGEHGQHPDRVLIKRERRRKRSELLAEVSGKPVSIFKAVSAKPRKFQWPKRKLQSRNTFKSRPLR